MTDRLANYEPVQERLTKFWADHPRGRVVPKIVERDDKHVIAECEIWFDITDPVFTAMGTASEVHDGSPVNRQGWMLENAETSAIGRALANAGYPGQGGTRPTAEDMHRVEARDRRSIADQALAAATYDAVKILATTPKAATLRALAEEHGHSPDTKPFDLASLAADPEWRAIVDEHVRKVESDGG